MEKYFRDTSSIPNQVLRLMVWIIIISSFIFGVLLNNRLLLFLSLGLILIEGVIQGLKYGVKSIFGVNSITSRPPKARDCGAFIDCKKEKATSMGMPSGHSISMGFFAAFMIMSLGKKNVISDIFVVFLALLVMTQRWWVGCHTILQVITGGVIGVLLGIGYYEIVKKWLPLGKNTKLY